MSRMETVLLLLLLAMVVAGLALAPTRRVGESAPGLSHDDWSRVSDDPARHLTLSWMGIPAYSADEGTWIEQHLETRFNIDLKPVFLDHNAFTFRKPLILAGGDIPDVMWEGDPLQVRRNVRNGFTLEMPYDLILREAPTYVKLLNAYGPEAWLYARWRGKNYGVPTYGLEGAYPLAPIWRMDWLRRMGFTHPPETLAEFHDAFHKLTWNDPDQNGRKDTYGLTTPMHWSLMFAEFFSAHGVLPFDFMQVDGKVVWGGLLPGTRQTLAMLRDWFAEGIIDPDFVTANFNADIPGKKFTSGQSGYLCDRALWNELDTSSDVSLYSTLLKLEPEAEIAASPPPIAADGDRHSRVWGGAAHVLCFGSQLSREPEKVLRVLHMLEAFAADEDLYIASRAGLRGVHWDFTPVKGIFLLPPYNSRTEGPRNMLFPLWIENPSGFFSPSSTSPDMIRKYLPDGMPAFTLQYRNPAWGMKNVLGKSDVVDAAGEYLEDLRQMQMRVFCEIITGEQPLDRWDSFVTEWRERGGDILTREANAMMAEKQTVYALAGVPPESVL